mmetsp:Transcript_21953/g.52220  ORF Transcript_21953/g.52220 Transcript_21953/m.52220 type:complete len:233 (+) Transcript_21953:1080-1778(+)
MASAAGHGLQDDASVGETQPPPTCCGGYATGGDTRGGVSSGEPLVVSGTTAGRSPRPLPTLAHRHSRVHSGLGQDILWSGRQDVESPPYQAAAVGRRARRGEPVRKGRSCSRPELTEHSSALLLWARFIQLMGKFNEHLLQCRRLRSVVNVLVSVSVSRVLASSILLVGPEHVVDGHRVLAVVHREEPVVHLMRAHTVSEQRPNADVIRRVIQDSAQGVNSEENRGGHEVQS